MKSPSRLLPFLLPWLALGLAPALLAADKFLGFDVSNALIPTKEIHPGGPPRDGIPSIDRPKFVAPNAAEFMRLDDQIVSVTVDGETRAYPLRVLVWHEIVNDTVNGTPLAITYCPLCGTVMVFDRRYAGRELTFGVSGLLYQSDVLMYDRQTESLWSQLAMKSVAGPQAGTGLTWVASEQMTWRAWLERYPGGKVLSTSTGFDRDYQNLPYQGYEQTSRTMFPVPHKRKELGNKEWVAGIILGGQAKAFPIDGLSKGAWMDDTVGGVGIRLRYEAAAEKLEVVRADNGAVVPTVRVYWFAWQAFYPETELWRQGK